MKKYKLIKEYPGSPKLGTEIEEISNGYKYSPNGIRTDFINKNIENYPEI